MKKAHTPGPWSWDDKAGDAGGLVVRSNSGDRIARVCWWGEQSETPWATEANARLIASAPELLSELEAARDIIHNALSLMTTAQKSEWGRLNEAAGVEGEGVTRRHERDAVIAKVIGKA